MQQKNKDHSAEIQRDALYAQDEAAFLLNVKPRTMEYWRQIGKGPKYVRLGTKKGINYFGKHLLEYATERVFGSTSEEEAQRVA